MPFKYKVEIDFIRDFNSNLRNQLVNLGFDPNIISENDDVCFQYLNLKRKLVEQKPRKILISKEFNCPDNLLKGLEIVKDKIIKGEDISNHLSKKILDLDYHDDLLNDWGIHHLHLGEKLGKDNRFIRRTGPVLFVRFDDEYAYFVDVMTHGNWANQEIVRIIHLNWPESIKQFRAKGFSRVTPRPTNEQYKKLRESHFTTLVEAETGVVYFPIGQGYMSSGHSQDVVRTCDYHFNRLKAFEKHVINTINLIAPKIKKKNPAINDTFTFLLGIDQKTVYAFEVHSHTFIELGEL